MSGLAARARAIQSWQVTLGVALLALGFLIAAQLRSEGPRVRYTTQERAPLIDAVTQLQARQDELRSQIRELNERVGASLSQGQGSGILVETLNRQLAEARVAAGLVALEGRGLVLQVEDSLAPAPIDGNETDYLVSGRDIRTVVEELWLSGAEAIAVNSERIVGSSAILDIGGSVLVNQAYLAPPYQIAAIGPPEMYRRLVGSEGFVDFVRTRAEGFGIQIGFAEPESVTIPAYAGTVSLRYADPIPPGGPGPAPGP